ncbi:hypothetical protein HZS_2139 [Henneguya salminicola]|nr:hypothetical protein HZS_2139 [Henneguya salminicola]
MKPLIESFFGKEITCECICEILPLELKIYYRFKYIVTDFRETKLKPQYVGIEIKDETSKTSLFKFITLVLITLENNSNPAVIITPKKMFEISLTKVHKLVLF